jgi:hypothetical protein
MRGNPVGYRNLYRHLKELLSYLEISLDSDFVLEELNAALYESESTFGRRHQLSNQLRSNFKHLYNKYIDKKALPIEENEAKRLRKQIMDWISKYYQQPPM